jgi:hypothetical protein
LLLLAVAVVFFAPLVDLEPTALRASRAAQAVQAALISAAFVLSGLLCIAVFCFPGGSLDSHLMLRDNLFVLNCARLC